MKIKDVIKKVATMLQLNNLIDVDFDYDTEDLLNNRELHLEGEEESINENSLVNELILAGLDAQTKKDVNLIISCINSVLCDIATDYLPLKMTETISVQNGEFELNNLSKSFHKLISVNTSKSYTVKQEKLFLEDGDYKVTYNYIPSEYQFGDSIVDFNGKLTIYALSFGVCAEFCLISGNFSESEMWNSRFENAMQIAKRITKVPQIKGRKWL